MPANVEDRAARAREIRYALLRFLERTDGVIETLDAAWGDLLESGLGQSPAGIETARACATVAAARMQARAFLG